MVQRLLQQSFYSSPPHCPRRRCSASATRPDYSSSPTSAALPQDKTMTCFFDRRRASDSGRDAPSALLLELLRPAALPQAKCFFDRRSGMEMLRIRRNIC